MFLVRHGRIAGAFHATLVGTFGFFLAASCARGGSGSLHGISLPRPLQVGEAHVTEVRGAGGLSTPFRFRATPGKVLYVFFGYANCPDICPTALSDLRRALRRLGPDSSRVEVAFVTVDPVRDTTEAIVPFLAAFVRGGHALRPATQEELADAERAFGATSVVTRRADGGVDVSHTGASYVVDAGGRVLVEWDYGIRPADMAADLALLLRLQDSAR